MDLGLGLSGFRVWGLQGSGLKASVLGQLVHLIQLRQLGSLTFPSARACKVSTFFSHRDI